MTEITMISINILALVVGFLIGYFLSGKKKKNYDGAMVVDTHDYNKDVFTLELAIPVGEILNRDELVLKVVCDQEEQ